MIVRVREKLNLVNFNSGLVCVCTWIVWMWSVVCIYSLFMVMICSGKTTQILRIFLDKINFLNCNFRLSAKNVSVKDISSYSSSSDISYNCHKTAYNLQETFLCICFLLRMWMMRSYELDWLQGMGQILLTFNSYK